MDVFPHSNPQSFLPVLSFTTISYYVYRIHQEQEKSELLQGTVSILRHQLTEKDEVLLCMLFI